MNFRPDINGLRAIAVLGVVLFHFLGKALPGGFAGVDVFFVISGFLMTSIVFRGLENNKFGILNFYRARTKRIVPALSVLCLILLVVGWFFLHPHDYHALAKHTLGTLTFSSNFLYLKESGYFDEASREKWLLHTWSLSVEWQFYLLYPIVVVLLGKIFRLPALRAILIGGAVASFCVCVYATGRWPSSAFFLLPTRAWEMLAGGLAYLYPRALTTSAKRLAEGCGLILILASYIGFSEANVWPGYLALVPVTGTLLIITAHRRESWLTGNPVVQWIGTSSYSIYLWHWPCVVWLNYVGKGEDPVYVGMGLLLSFGFGTLSYYLVEKRVLFFEFGRHIARVAGSNLGAVYTVALAMSLAVFYRDGFDSRLDETYRAMTQNHEMPTRENGYCFVDFNNDTLLKVSDSGTHCMLGDRTKPIRALLFGNSFAGHYEPFWDVIGKANGVAINSITTNWCIPIEAQLFDGPDKGPAFQQCQLNRKYLLREMGRYDVVIFGGMWSNSLNGRYLDQVVDMIRYTSRHVGTVIVMPSPVRYDTNVLKRFHRSLFYGVPFDLQLYSTKLDSVARQAHDLLKSGTAELSNVIVIDRNQIFPSSASYEKAGVNVPFSLDGMHITVEGAVESARVFQQTELYRAKLQPLLSKRRHLTHTE